MKLPDFKIPEEDDLLYRVYRESVHESDGLDRKHIHAGKNILILPHDSMADNDSGHINLYIDSSRGFGDGRHPTTVLCLALIEEYLDGLPGAEKKDLAMIDIGTGTGILSILASRMGVDNILALDIDPDVVTSAREMAMRNGAGSIDFQVMDAAFLGRDRAFGLVTANLLPPILRTVIPLAAHLTLPGALAIVSGIGDASCDEMQSLMTGSGFIVKKHITSGWWHAFLLIR